jgi:TPR repeat protein
MPRCVRELAAQEESPGREEKKMPATPGLKADATETKKLCETASTWFEKAASAGDHAAQAKLGQEFYSTAARLKMMASMVSSNGDSASDQETEDELNQGGGVLKLACTEALRWLNQAAAAHEPNAESALASGYLVGVACVKRDEQKAVDWYTRAHEDGDFSASEALAAIYWEDGNFADAHRWIATAESEAAIDEETAWQIVEYYKLGDVNEEKADYWRQRAESLDAEQDEKYPALNLIHEKEMEAARQEPVACQRIVPVPD